MFFTKFQIKGVLKFIINYLFIVSIAIIFFQNLNDFFKEKKYKNSEHFEDNS